MVLPVFLQLCRDLPAGEVGLIAFLRPGCGAIVATVLSRLIAKKRVNLVSVIRGAVVMYLLGWLWMLVASEVEMAWLKPAIMLQLCMQAGSSFCV